jgi:hypothetical protein
MGPHVTRLALLCPWWRWGTHTRPPSTIREARFRQSNLSLLLLHGIDVGRFLARRVGSMYSALIFWLYIPSLFSLGDPNWEQDCFLPFFM